MTPKKKDPKKTVKKESVDLVKAQMALEKDRERRINKCKAEIDACLQKYKCTVVPTITLTGERQVARIDILAIE